MGITSLTITLNMRTVDVILIILIISVRVFLTNPDTKRRRRSVYDEYPVLTKDKKKTSREEEGGALTTTTNTVFIRISAQPRISAHPKGRKS